MSKNGIAGIFNGLGYITKKHISGILIAVGVTGMISAGVLAVAETPKAIRLMEEKKVSEDKEKLTAKEMVKTTWKCYIPAAVTYALSVTCIICACSVQSRRSAALATACSLSETALIEYKNKVKETIGEKKETAIRDAIAKDRIESDPVSVKEIVFTDSGNTLCYEVLSGRYFRSDIEKLRRVENELNKRMLSEMYISLNELYYEIDSKDLPGIKIGDLLGWNLEKGMIHFEFSSQLTDNGVPCLVLGYSIPPQYEYA